MSYLLALPVESSIAKFTRITEFSARLTIFRIKSGEFGRRILGQEERTSSVANI
jgi:hypothetical protein